MESAVVVRVRSEEEWIIPSRYRVSVKSSVISMVVAEVAGNDGG